VQPALLCLDDALTGQYRLRDAVAAAGGIVMDCRDLGPALRLWSRPQALAALRQRIDVMLPESLGPLMVFSGSGDFHHVTPMLLGRALEAVGRPATTVLHFDNHPDWVRFGTGAHCGSWVGLAARLDGVAKLVTIGVCSNDIARPAAKGADLTLVTEDRLELYAYRAPGSLPAVQLCGRSWPTIESLGETAFTDLLASRVETEAVYVTIDKDVLCAADAGTNWDQGRTTLDLLQNLIFHATQGRRIIGVDVVGDWSKPTYGGGVIASLLKAGEALMDQPWRRPPSHILAVNERVNLALLRQFQTGSA